MNLIIAILYETCSFQINHSLPSLSISSKSTSKIDILIKILTLIVCSLYVSVITANYTVYLFILATIHGISIFQLFLNLPNYDFFMNFIKIAMHAECFITIVFFFISYLMKDANIVMVLVICIQPVMMILIYEIIKYRLTKLPSIQDLSTENFMIFELSTRAYLHSGELKESMVKVMNRNYKLSKNKCILVLEANYCNEVLNNPMLALIKISRVNHHGINFIDNYQVFKCKEILQEINSKISDGYKLHNYLLELQKNKKEDILLCEELLKLCERIIDKNSSLSLLKKSINSTDHIIKTVKLQYESLIKVFQIQEKYLICMDHCLVIY